MYHWDLNYRYWWKSFFTVRNSGFFVQYGRYYGLNKLLHVSRTTICSRSHVKTRKYKKTTRYQDASKVEVIVVFFLLMNYYQYRIPNECSVRRLLIFTDPTQTNDSSNVCDWGRPPNKGRVTLFKQPPPNKRLCYSQLVCLGGSRRIFVLKPASFYLSITVKFSLVLTVFQMQTALYK